MDMVKSGRSSCNSSSSSSVQSDQEDMMSDLRRGPWTVEEDLTLINYIANHGEGRWNSLARCAGLKRTGKSCRLRWLNYLRPDVRRGNITLEEQLLILDLHSRWGNRWSKIAQHLPGRTDNEIKNYWRTRVQKHAKQLKCDVNSKQFKDTMRYLWMPRLVERIQAAAAASSSTATATATAAPTTTNHQFNNLAVNNFNQSMMLPMNNDQLGGYTPENSSTAASSDSFGTQVSPVSDLTAENYYSTSALPVNNNNPNPPPHHDQYSFQVGYSNNNYNQSMRTGYDNNLSSSSITNTTTDHQLGLDHLQAMEQNSYYNWNLDQSMDPSENLWDVDYTWLLQHQLNNGI